MNHVLKLVPDAIGRHTYEVLHVMIDSNITALAVDATENVLYFATSSPQTLHGLTVGTGNIYRVRFDTPNNRYDHSFVCSVLLLLGL